MPPLLLGCLLLGLLMAAEANDALGDPLPAGAGQRLGTLRLRCAAPGGLAYLPDGRGVILAAGSVEIWDLALGQRQSSTKVSPSPLTTVQRRRDGQVLLLGDAAGTVREWDPGTLREVRSWDTGQQQIRTACYSPDGQRVLTAANLPPGLKEWDLATGRTEKVLTGAALGAFALAVSPDGKLAAAGCRDSVLREYDLASGHLRRELRGHRGCVRAVCYLPGGGQLASSADDGAIRLWPAAADQPARVLSGHRGGVLGLAVAGDGQRLLSCGRDGTLRLWDTNRAQELRRLDPRAGWLSAVAFSADGESAIAAGRDGRIRQYSLTTGQCLRELAQRSWVHALASTADRTRITGLRVEGPYAGPELIAEFSYGLSIAHHDCEVDNCEVYNWNCVGIGVGGGGEVRIHHNRIHHCQLSGYGYGVTTGRANCLIIANRFDWCRHDIASSGSPGDCYEAAWNLVGENATAHRFDMHGGRDRGDSTDDAGDWMHVHHNTFQDAKRHAVVIRGVPTQGVDIHHNRFAQATPGEAISSGGNTTVRHNACGPEKIRVE
jgi:WD40 repeat protein